MRARRTPPQGREPLSTSGSSLLPKLRISVSWGMRIAWATTPFEAPKGTWTTGDTKPMVNQKFTSHLSGAVGTQICTVETKMRPKPSTYKVVIYKIQQIRKPIVTCAPSPDKIGGKESNPTQKSQSKMQEKTSTSNPRSD